MGVEEDEKAFQADIIPTGLGDIEIDPSDKMVKIKKITDPTEADIIDCITIESFRICCDSDKFVKGGQYAGMIVWNIGSYPAKEKTGRNILPGYIYIKDTTTKEFQS